MEATFSFSRHFYTKPIFAPHHRKPPFLGFHVDQGYHLQPSSPPSFALQAWPTTLKAHGMMWAIDALPKAKVNGRDCMPSWPTQNKVSRKAWAGNSLLTPNANGRDGRRAWTMAFVAMTVVTACAAGDAMGMRGMMVTPPAIASLLGDQPFANDVVASEALTEFLDVGLKVPPKGGDDVVEKVSSQLGTVIDYPILKKTVRLKMTSDQAKEIMKMLQAKFEED